MNTDLKLLRLLQLVSPSLPIGMYSYSQGLEMAVEDHLLNNADTTEQWLQGIMEHSLARLDLPILSRMVDAWLENDSILVKQWSVELLANRETSELRMEDRQTGQALARLLTDMELKEAKPWVRDPQTTLAVLYALVVTRWHIDKQAALSGYLWSWLENQVLCAVKLVPLGQVAGQKLLFSLTELIPDLVEIALNLNDEDIGGSVFGMALTSSRHEMQYSRLFRS